MPYDMENQPLKMLSELQLKIPALQLLGHAKFRETYNILGLHKHEGMEFIVVLKGTQQYVIDDVLYTLRGGDIFMTFPCEIHGGGQTPQDVAEIIWFQVDYSSPEGFLGLVPPYSTFLYQQLSSYKKRIHHVSQKELGRLKDAFEMLSQDDRKKQLMGYHLFMEFVVRNLCESDDVQAGTADLEKTENLSSVKEYIHKHLTSDLSVECLAELCGMSFSKFNSWFKEQAGLTPHAYIVNQKIDLAKRLLKNPENTITDIAFLLNFSSSDYFSSVFKKYTGCTPTQYRQKNSSMSG